MQKTYLLLYGDDVAARTLATSIAQHHDMRPIFVTAPDATRRTFCPPAGKLFFGLGADGAPGLVRRIQAWHAPVAMVPVDAVGVALATVLCEPMGLNVGGNATALSQALGHVAYKTHLTVRHPRIVTSASVHVADAAAVFAQRRDAPFVLRADRPGTGVTAEVFAADASRDDVASFFSKWATSRAQHHHPVGVVMEPWLAGETFRVVGQLDALGLPSIHAVLRRTEQGQLHVMATVSRQDVRFAALAHYARAVADVSNLCRLPFVVDVVLTAMGPRLLRFKPYLACAATCQAVRLAHAGACCPATLAAHHYLDQDTPEPNWGNWQHYDRAQVRHVAMYAPRVGTLWRCDGIADVEALPDFVCWTHRPALTGTFGSARSEQPPAYAMLLRAYGSDAAIEDTQAWVMRQLRINAGVNIARKVLVGTVFAVGQARTWVARVQQRMHLRRVLGLANVG